MKSSRAAIRHSCKLLGSLWHRGTLCPCILENISERGALVRLRDSTGEPIQTGDECTLTIFRGNEKPVVKLSTTVIHHGFTLVGLKFVESNAEKNFFMEQLMMTVAAGVE